MGDVLTVAVMTATLIGVYAAGYDRGRKGMIAKAVLRLEQDEMGARHRAPEDEDGDDDG